MSLSRTLSVLGTVAMCSAGALAHDEPGSTTFDLLVPDEVMSGSIVFATLLGPPGGEEVLHATWDLTFVSPHGGTPASDVELDLGVFVGGVKTTWVITGADLGWPSATGTFHGTLGSDLLNGVLDGGLFGVSTPDLQLAATTGGLTGQFVGSRITLELAAPEVCQVDLGFDGPGLLALSLCGDPLGSGGVGTLSVTGATPASPVFVLLSTQADAVPFKGGTLVPVPILVLLDVSADGAGGIELPVPGGQGPLTVFTQAVAPDAGVPLGFAISSALQIELLP